MELVVNGTQYGVSVAPFEPLAHVLRESLGLRGTKVACGEGTCGSCTVLLDGLPVLACILPVGLLAGRDVRTVEGLGGPDDGLAPLQTALLERGAVQCGMCTPGVLMAATALLGRKRDLDAQAVREALAGNLCRCTGYEQIIEAVLDVATASS